MLDIKDDYIMKWGISFLKITFNRIYKMRKLYLGWNVIKLKQKSFSQTFVLNHNFVDVSKAPFLSFSILHR